MESAAAAAARQRKACINCYQKKVRCDFPPQAVKCTRCVQNGLECLLPTETQKPSRPSMRSGFEDLSSRVRQLEDAVFLAQESAPAPVYSAARSSRVSGTTVSSNGQGGSPVDSTKPAAVRAYRGDTSPWVSLIDHVDSKAEFDPQFQETAYRLAEDERSNSFTVNAISYDLLHTFPHLQRPDVFRHITAYAIDAPFPILHYDSLLEITEQILDTYHLARWGQIACILMYMSFGSTLVVSETSSAELQRQAEVYLRAAWDIMPQLILDHDLWALKALTLMVHYLQASSKPEACWTLLGSASRMAVSLGFHQKTRRVEAYSAIEAEEGKRAWWLCLIMEKTFCTTFGYPSTSSSSSSPSDNDRPVPFQPTGHVPPPPTPTPLPLNANAIFGANELEAVAFFNDMIDLTRLRDSILTTSPTLPTTPSPTSTSALLLSTLRDEAQGAFAPVSTLSAATNSLRDSISDLAHYNAIQVIAVHLCPPPSSMLNSNSGRTGAAGLPAEATLSARATLQVILETRTRGTTMCLWMWLYYAFTASVVLFLGCVGDSERDGVGEEAVVFDLALLDELVGLCEVLGSGGGGGSEGARRVREIVEGMGRVGWKVVKSRTTMRRRRKKRAGEGEGGAEAGPETRKRFRSGAEGAGEGEAEREQEGLEESGGGEIRGEMAGEGEGEGAGEVLDLDLENVPQNFAWEQWDQWLEDAPFELG